VPDIGTQDNVLTAVAGSDPMDIWAVGYYFTPSSQVNTLVEHWDGTSWSVISSPDVPRLSHFRVVDC
jgi:hypothetical protein